MASREEILADFQACTGIEDVEVAILQLDEVNWSLVDAVNKAIPGTPASSMSASTATNTGPSTIDETGSSERRRTPSPPIVVDETTTPLQMPRFAPGISLADDFMAGPSYQPRTRMLEFNVQHNERIIHLKVPDNEELHTLKVLLQSETGCPPCQQDLRGLKNAVFPLTDHRKLSELNLPKENFLHLVTPNNEIANVNGAEQEEDDSDFVLLITDESKQKEYKLNFRPTQSILGVKIDLSTLTEIPVSRQKWTGWPEDISDELSLAQIDIPRTHKLSLAPLIETPKNGPSTSSSIKPILIDSDDEFEDASDMMDDDDVYLTDKSRRIQPLLPDEFGSDEATGAIKFAEEFSNRYGQPHPAFFPGSLDDAIRESCLQPAKDRKMLAAYMHHDSSVLTNVFCTQALCADSVCGYLNENFVTFGWDLTFASNKNMAVNMMTRHFGSVAGSTLKSMDTERLPVLILISKLRGTLEISQIIHGNVMLDELMSRLLAAHEAFVSQLAVEIREEEERAARDAVKREQDLAFEMSLMADRQKEAERQQEEADRAAREEEERKQKEKTEKLREARVRKLSSRLPPEPQEEKVEGKPVSQLRFRVPDVAASGAANASDASDSGPPVGKRNLERRFLASETLQVVLDYLTIEGFPHEEYKVLSSWPRRDLTQFETDQTLQELKLYPQETLTLEEKH